MPATSTGMKSREDRQFEKFCLTGSPRALGAVYDIVAPELLEVAKHLAGGALDAEDLVQRTFVTAIERTSGFKRGQRVTPWLLGILAHHAKNEKRSAARQADPAVLLSRVVDPPEEAAEAAELEQQLEVALASLPEEQRSVLTLRLRHNLSAVQIAEALGRPAGTVRSQLARGMERMREVLPAGLVASTLLALGLPRGLALGREALLVKASVNPLSKLVAVKGYCLWVLAPLAQAVFMKKLSAAALVLFASFAGLRWIASDALISEAEVPSARLVDCQLAATELPRSQPPAQGGERAKPFAASTRTSIPLSLAPEPSGPVGNVQVRVQDGSGRVIVGEICLLETRDSRSVGTPEFMATTNAKGVALFEDVPIGSASVRSLRTHSEKVWVRKSALVHMVLTEHGGIDVEGTVLDPNGLPVPHAYIWLAGYKIKRADESGHFTLISVRQHSAIAASAPGYALRHQQIPPTDSETTVEMTLVLEAPGGRIVVKAIDGAGHPLGNVELRLSNEDSDNFDPLDEGLFSIFAPVTLEKTDARGVSTLHSVPVGSIKVTAHKAGFGWGQAQVEVLQDQANPVQLTLFEEATVSGTIAHENGAPIISADVGYDALAGFPRIMSKADETGHYSLAGLPPGEALVIAYKSDFGSVQQRVFTSPGDHLLLDLVVPEQPSIRGVIVNANDEPMFTWLWAHGEQEGGGSRSDFPDKDGRFTLLVEENAT
ncbi:MAG: RNA polymerase sigma factor (sigma-70 family), partial [Planctomycetota bacterium]